MIAPKPFVRENRNDLIMRTNRPRAGVEYMAIPQHSCGLLMDCSTDLRVGCEKCEEVWKAVAGQWLQLH
jgi:hypothetical protein